MLTAPRLGTFVVQGRLQTSTALHAVKMYWVCADSGVAAGRRVVAWRDSQPREAAALPPHHRPVQSAPIDEDVALWQRLRQTWDSVARTCQPDVTDAAGTTWSWSRPMPMFHTDAVRVLTVLTGLLQVS